MSRVSKRQRSAGRGPPCRTRLRRRRRARRSRPAEARHPPPDRDAAWALFTELGYDGTTTKAVAERAEVAAGTVFVHARDKADLLMMVMHDRLAAMVDAAFETLPRRGPLLPQLLHVFSSCSRCTASSRSCRRRS